MGGKVQCNDLVFFFYLTDVNPGDGGLIIIPCSPKSNFPYSKKDFYPDSYTEEGDYRDDYYSTDVPEGVLNITPKAGDVVIISELVTHGALSWAPKDRDRRFLTLRYGVQHLGPGRDFPDAFKARLSPETLELMETHDFNTTKEIVEREVGELS